MILKTIIKKVIATGMIATMTAFFLTGCGAEAGLIDFASYAKGIDEITLPNEVSVIALGEATHGNVEFQELKLDVFSHLVENTEVRAFALEGDFGSCAMTNEYILYDKGTATEAVENLGFEIYKTDEMLELVQWMHDHNLEASEDEKVRLYGFDMQQHEGNIHRIKTFYQTTDAAKGEDYLSKWDTYYILEDGKLSTKNLSNLRTLLNDILSDLQQHKDTYIGATNEESYAYALQSATCLHQLLDLYDASTDFNSYGDIRDKYMAENVKWILEREGALYDAKVMLSGHNGHVAKTVNSSYTNMGYYLSQELKERYFVIGTDFYKTTCNIASEGERANHSFCSEDPLAKAVGDLEENVYYLDFDEAAASEELSTLIHSNMKTGSLGESYSPLMKLLKNTYQLSVAPGTLYDAMIFVYEATPTKVWDSQ